jgi:thioredoxin-like negative regulator of GroEL
VKPDWDLLAEEAHPSVFIADVNCQLQDSLCADHHTGGHYPTILIFQNGKEPELYRGGRGFEDLRKFVDETLVTKCDLTRLEETCSEKEQNYASKWKERGDQAWKKEVSRLDVMTGDTMTYELSKWLRDRVRILEQFLATDPKDEL